MKDKYNLRYAVLVDFSCLTEVPENVNLRVQQTFAAEIAVPNAVFSRSRVKFNDAPLRASWAWALASCFSFTCCALGLLILYVSMFPEWGCHDMRRWSQHPGPMLPEEATI